MNFGLAGRRAIVTGHRGGIGAAIAEVRTQDGAEVIGLDLPDFDLADTATLETRLATLVAERGPIDILVNNAGSLMERVSFEKMTESRWDEVMDLNLKSAMLAAQAAAPGMIARKRGNVINIVSIAGRNGGGPGAGAYATAKGGLITLTKALAKEFAPHGIRVNAVSPGVIDTPFHEVFSTPEMIATFVKGIPLGRVGTSEEVANVIAFLASEAASYITGETIEVNGGQLML